MASLLTNAAGISDGDTLYEVVNGEIVEIAPMGVYEGWIASLLTAHLQNFVADKLGRVVTEVLFDFTTTLGKKRRPDLAFVSYARWPKEKLPPRTEAWDVVPNICIETRSPTIFKPASIACG
jgi:Uma2 family endonuclease